MYTSIHSGEYMLTFWYTLQMTTRMWILTGRGKLYLTRLSGYSHTESKLRRVPTRAAPSGFWNTEKVHSIMHGSRNLKKVGRSRNISTQTTESKLKDVKAKGHMTNRDPATYGYSIMAAEIREAAAQQMAIDADQYGMYRFI
jgi:hypothetical protein